jgi:RND family efflux transporter MFP subunit
MHLTNGSPPRSLLAVGALGLLLAAGGLGAVHHLAQAADSKAGDAPAARPSLTVTSALARLQNWPVTLSASGAVAAWMEASIGARITGLPLVDVLVNVGDRVKKGQLLARFDDATVRTELDQLEAALAQTEAAARQAEASASQAELNRDRALSIRDSGAISDQDLLQYTTQATTARAQLAQTRAQIAQARAQLAATRLRLEFTRVVAPDDGIISARGATVGSVSQAAGGGSELFKLIRQGRLEWRPELTGAQLVQVKPGMTVRVELPDGSSVQGRVRQLAPTLDSATRLGLAYVDLAPGSRALPSMYLSGTLQFAQHRALTVPAESVVIRDGRSYVLRLDGQRSRLTAVDIGRRQGRETEITRGLADGDRVIVQGAGFLNDNDLVRVVDAAPAEGVNGPATGTGVRR